MFKNNPVLFQTNTEWAAYNYTREAASPGNNNDVVSAFESVSNMNNYSEGANANWGHNYTDVPVKK